MHLSKRLLALTSFVTPGSRLADIGTDHGYVPIYLVENGIIPSAIAMDINEGPLKKAQEHIIEHQLEGKITTRLSDGLDKLKSHEADTVLIAIKGAFAIVLCKKVILQKLECTKECSAQTVHLINNHTVDPDRRISVIEILNHPFYAVQGRTLHFCAGEAIVNE